MKREDMIEKCLSSQRLDLVEISLSDTDDLVNWRSDPNVYRYFLNPHALTKEEHIKWYQEKYLMDTQRFDWIAYRTNDRSKLGVFGLKVDKEKMLAEVNYLLAPQYQGYGYALEAVDRLIKCAKDDFLCTSVIAMVHEENRKSIQLAEKLGMKRKERQAPFWIYEKDKL